MVIPIYLNILVNPACVVNNKIVNYLSLFILDKTMNRSNTKNESLFCVAIKWCKEFRNITGILKRWPEDQQNHSEENSDDNDTTGSWIWSIKGLYGNKTLFELRKETSAKFLGSDQHQLQISQIYLALERIQVSDEGNENMNNYAIKMVAHG